VLIAERVLQRKIEFYNSPAMERGLIVEAEAADWYEFDKDVTAQRVGFITDGEHRCTVGRASLEQKRDHAVGRVEGTGNSIG
jgi:hypothetical protein